MDEQLRKLKEFIENLTGSVRILFHHDVDGIISAAILVRILKTQNIHDIHLKPCNPNEKHEKFDGQTFILDTDWMEFQTGAISGLKPSADEQGYVGSATVGWYEMNAKQYNDIGCLPLCDRVALASGRPARKGNVRGSRQLVSSLEALRQIRAMPDGEKARHGVWSSMQVTR